MGVFANAITFIGSHGAISCREEATEKVGLGAWLADRLRRRAVAQPRLAVIERIHLAPRQTLALVEADGQKLLVATSADGTSSFFPLKAGATPRNFRRYTKSDSEGKPA